MKTVRLSCMQLCPEQRDGGILLYATCIDHSVYHTPSCVFITCSVMLTLDLFPACFWIHYVLIWTQKSREDTSFIWTSGKRWDLSAIWMEQWESLTGDEPVLQLNCAYPTLVCQTVLLIKNLCHRAEGWIFLRISNAEPSIDWLNQCHPLNQLPKYFLHLTFSTSFSCLSWISAL